MKPYPAYKESGVEWIGAVPEGWEVKRLKWLSKNIVTGRTPPTDIPEYFDGNIDWFTPADFGGNLVLHNASRKISKSAVENLGLELYPKRSVLLVGIGATLGKIGIIEQEAYSNQQINAILFNEQEMTPYFGAYFLDVFRDMIVSSSNAATLAILNQTKTKGLDIFVPPLPEQRASPPTAMKKPRK